MHESDNILLIGIASASAAAAAAGATLILLFTLAIVGFTSFQLIEEENQRAELEALAQKSQAQLSVEIVPKPRPVNYNASIEECLQNPHLAGGCEIASMTSVLRAFGYDIDLIEFTEDYVLKVKGEPDMVHAYAGSPYVNGAAFPPAMAHAGNDYLREQKSDWRFIERTNLSLDKLLEIVRLGRPVLVWTTMFGAHPSFTGESIEGYLWYNNEHCVVLYGETETGNLCVMDPLQGFIEQDREQFRSVYEACGFHTLTLSQSDIETIDKAEADKVEAYEKRLGGGGQ